MKGFKNPWFDSVDKRYSRHAIFKAGGQEMLRCLFELAKASPTGTFAIDSKVQQFTSRVRIVEE